MKTVPSCIQFAAIILLALSAPITALAGEVSGAFSSTEDGKAEEIRPTHAAAFRIQHFRNPDQHGTQVMLTLVPFDAEAASQAENPALFASNQAGVIDMDHVVVTVWDDGTGSLKGIYDVGNRQFMSSAAFDDQFRMEILSRTDDQISARVWTENPIEMFETDSYQADLTFTASIAGQ